MPSNDVPVVLEELPPSAELVYRALRECDAGEATVSDLDSELCCARRTIEDSLHRLKDAGVVESRPNPKRASQRFWHLGIRDEA